MEMIPGWIAIISITMAATISIVYILSRSVGPFRSVPFLTGMRFARRYPDQTLTRSIPVALLAAVLIGSLSVGDGLLEMVETNTDRNLSNVDMTLTAPSFIEESYILRSGIDRVVGVSDLSPIIHLDASASVPGGSNSGAVIVLGVREDVFDLLPMETGSDNSGTPPRHHVIINEGTAISFSLGKGDSIIVDIDPFRGSSNNLLGLTREDGVRLNLTIFDIMKDTGIGRYREDARDVLRPILLIDLDYLQERIDRVGEVNKVLISAHDGSDHRDTGDLIMEAMDNEAGLGPAGLHIEEGSLSFNEFVYSEDLFYHGNSIVENDHPGQILSYFVDSISSGNVSVPYSVITGLDTKGGYGSSALDLHGLDNELEEGEIALTNWTADRLDVEIGETIRLDFRVIDDLGVIRDSSSNFTYSRTIPLVGGALEEGFIPGIEGVTDSPTCGDWDPGFEIDLDSMDENDTAYWEHYRTAPKGYISLSDARSLWSNPYGDTTAIKVRDNDTGSIDERIDTSYLGISMVLVRENAVSSSSALLIFPAMFLTFGSMIMIGALLILHAVIVDLSRKRDQEWGVLRSMGVKRKGLRAAAIGEALPGIGAGLLLGVPLGALLGYLLNRGLGNAWSSTVEGADVPFIISMSTFMVSITVTLAVSWVLVLFSTGRVARNVVASNLRETDPSISASTRGKRTLLILAGASGAVIGTIFLIAGTGLEGSALLSLFTIGSMMVAVSVSLLLFGLVAGMLRSSDISLMVSANISRRPGKHPLAIVLLTMALTLSLSLTAVAAIMEGNAVEEIEGYGGGYDTVIELPVPYRSDVSLEGMELAIFLSYGSEGGTCSNLNAIYPPRLLGAPESVTGSPGFDLQERDSSFGSDSEAWFGLEDRIDGSIPIMVDRNTLQWIYYSSLGSEFRITGENGEEETLMVIGVLEPSILTGTFVMSFGHLRELFPSGATASYILAGGGIEEEVVRRSFSSYSPLVTPVEELARENIRSELSYLYLFRDFLVIGLLVSLTSSAVFTHVRALSLRRELEMLRRIGATGKRTIVYFMVENLVIFTLVILGSISGALLSISLYGDSISTETPIGSTVLPVSLVVSVFMGVSLITAVVSAWWSMRSMGKGSR